MADANNVDATLVQVINEQMNPASALPPIIQHTQEAPPENIPNENESVEPEVKASHEETVEQSVDNVSQVESTSSESSPIDEYGNPLEKPKMYSEDEVQRMIRDRLSRGRQSDQQPTPREVKQATDDFKADPTSEETWEVQLEQFIDKTLEKRQAKIADQQWRQQETAKQADFEAKFTSGMEKYKDFHDVIKGKPLTDTIMLATRSLDNPAAFIYGACKLHPGEIENIAKMNDPYAQSAAVGRLHEKMVRSAPRITSAPRPLEAPKGDMLPKPSNQPSLEDRINQYAKQKRK